MYAAVRHGERWGWEVRAVDGDGSNVPVLLRRAPAAYHGVTFLLSDFEGLSDEQRRTACLALGEVARSQYPEATEVVIDRVLSRVPMHPDEPPAPAVERTTVEQCGID